MCNCDALTEMVEFSYNDFNYLLQNTDVYTIMKLLAYLLVLKLSISSVGSA